MDAEVSLSPLHGSDRIKNSKTARPLRIGFQLVLLLAGALVLGILIWQGVTASGAPDPTQPHTSKTVAILDIAVLVFREGLECILVLSAITASMVGNHRMHRRPVAAGAAVGFLVALTSIGSGSITLPLLLLALPAISLRKLIGSEIVFAALMVPVAAAGHVAFANVDWSMALSLTAGALPGAYLGARLSARLGEVSLRPAVIGILAFAGFKLL